MEEGILFDRSLDDVKGMISHAKLIESDLLPLSQIVRQEQVSQHLPAFILSLTTLKFVSVGKCFVVTFVG